jgi:hypothetical protein
LVGRGGDRDRALMCLYREEVRGGTSGVNHSGDSDSTGAITGNILGARLGVRAILERRLEPLELRSEIEVLAQDSSAPSPGSLLGGRRRAGGYPDGHGTLSGLVGGTGALCHPALPACVRYAWCRAQRIRAQRRSRRGMTAPEAVVLGGVLGPPGWRPPRTPRMSCRWHRQACEQHTVSRVA